MCVCVCVGWYMGESPGFLVFLKLHIVMQWIDMIATLNSCCFFVVVFCLFVF